MACNKVKAIILKTCNKCNQSKDESMFYKNNQRLMPTCRSCHNVSKPYEYNYGQLTLNTGLTKEQYDNILKSQGGSCAVCGRDRSNVRRRFSVDHCHATNKIRGLICDPCNRAIGLLCEDAELILRAAFYVLNADTGLTFKCSRGARGGTLKYTNSPHILKMRELDELAEYVPHIKASPASGQCKKLLERMAVGGRVLVDTSWTHSLYVTATRIGVKILMRRRPSDKTKTVVEKVS